jgi:hypothetical protein
MALNKTSTSFIGLSYRAVVNDDLAVVASFLRLGLAGIILLCDPPSVLG